MKRLRLLVPMAVMVAVVLLLVAPVGALAAPNTGGHEGGECDQWYTVKCGDTIGNIAWKFGVNSTELAQMNGLHNPNKIYVGQTLCVPAGHDDGKKDGWDDGQKAPPDDGKKDGWDDGQKAPPDDGQKDGWDDGKKAPPDDGQKDGWDEGQKDGWDNGHNEGWDDGHKDGCQGNCDGGFKYTVKCGDTIGNLAWKFGVNSTELAQINYLRNPNKIYVGQNLWIP
jgi:LysM repeat protein